MNDSPPSQKPDFQLIEGGDNRPEIKVTQETLDLANAASDAIALDMSIYKRAGSLVHVVRQDSTIPGGRRTLGIRELPHALLTVHLSQVARWLKYDAKRQAYGRVGVPSAIVNAVHDAGEWPKVRPLLAVANAPTMRPDGTVIQKKGYDVATGILYQPSRPFAEVPDDPTLDDAKKAADFILDYACDFPFAAPSDRSAWLACVLTLVVRNAITGPCPLFAIDGNTPGVGKSRLVDLAHIIAYGTKAPRSSISKQEEEMRKQITSLLIEGVGAALFDNIDSGTRFGGPAFDALLTSDVWRDRELGKSVVKTLPARAVWFATGNNMVFAGDLARRSMRIRLETDLSNPEQRERFRWGEGEKLFKAADRARVLLVTHALTIIRAYHHAGQPLKKGNSWGSYESWSRMVVDPIRWVGLADPLLSRATEDVDNLDPALMAAETLAIAMQDIGRDLTVRELLNMLYPPNHFDGDGHDLHASFGPAREQLESATSARGMPDLVRVGHLLKRMRNRRLSSGSRIVGEMDPHAKIIRWGVRAPAKKVAPGA